MLIKNLFPYLLAALFCVFFIYQCDQRKAIEQQNEQNVSALNDSLETYKNDYGQLISQKKALKGDKQSLKLMLSRKVDSLQNLKKLVDGFSQVDFAGNVNTKTVVDTVVIPYAKPISYEFARDFSADTEYYTIEGIATQESITLNTINIPTQLSMAIGKKKTGWFKSEYRFEATSSNPYVEISDLQGGTFEKYDSPVALSGQLGYGITPEGLQPYAGVGISVNTLQLLGF